jgi:sialate O-acetylesterase
LPKDEAPNEKSSPVQGFALRGGDNKWFWARATIDGENVHVSSSRVLHPTAVRYAWSNNPTCNLYNRDSLPADPFQAIIGQ